MIPVRLLQKAIILLNFKPFTYIFHKIYAFGLKYLIKKLDKLPALHSVFGCGSFFEGKCLYGISDIDLIFIIDEKYAGTDYEPYKICEVYNNVRRLFPFLGNWSEKSENIIYLSDAKAGFPIPESFRLRWKQGQLYKLYGDNLPDSFVDGPVSINEIVSEINTLVRIAVLKGKIHTGNLLFWKRIFIKLITLTKALGLESLPEQMIGNKDLAFLKVSEILLFNRKSNPENLFSLLLDMSHQVFKAIQGKNKQIVLKYNVLCDDNNYDLNFSSSAMKLRTLSETGSAPQSIKFNALRSSLFGITPRFNYFPMDEPICLIEVRQDIYKTVKHFIKSLYIHGQNSQSILIRTDFFLFIISKQISYVDIVPLDPIIFPNIHAAVNSKLNKNSNDQNEIEMVEEVYKEQKLLSENIFLALAGIYKKNEGWVKKLPFPCIYLEDDLVVIRDALHRIRVFLLHKDFVDIACPKMLIEFLSRKFPDCREFLNDMNDYYSFLIGQSGRKLYANNLYRRLHQFMSQMLSDASTISLESHKEHLGITVGIITRNRAEDLKDVLGSLTRQIRMPDEVLIVDNGSTDKTCSVIEEFRTKLPISYYFSKEASIPGARNMVVDKAKYEIISFTDDDCITEPGWLDSIERAFLRAENIGVVGGWVKHWPSAKSSIIDTYYGIFHNNTT